MTNNEMYKKALDILFDFRGIDSDAYYGNDDIRQPAIIATIVAQLIIKYRESEMKQHKEEKQNAEAQ